MSAAKITISIDGPLLQDLDRLVKDHVFSSRSQAIQEAVQDKLRRLRRTRLATESAKLDPNDERQLADLGLPSELENWPEY